MLSVIIEILPDELQFDEPTLGNITLKGEDGSISSRGPVMIVPTLCQLLDHVRKFILEDATQAELPLGIDSWFEPILLKDNDTYCFAKNSGEIISRSSKSELINVILNDSAEFNATYQPDSPMNESVVKDLTRAIEKFRSVLILKD